MSGDIDESPEPLQGVSIEGGRGPAAMGPGLEGAGLASELEQSSDGGDIDGESGGELPPGAFAVVDGVEDAFAEIVRQGLRESPPAKTWLSNRVPSECEPL